MSNKLEATFHGDWSTSDHERSIYAALATPTPAPQEAAYVPVRGHDGPLDPIMGIVAVVSTAAFVAIGLVVLYAWILP